MSSPRRLRTNSQAITNLEKMFRNLDLEGSGKLDMASFHTAMYSFEMEDSKKLEELFNLVDTEKDGYINYEEFLLQLKAGELNQTGDEIMETVKLRRTSSIESCDGFSSPPGLPVASNSHGSLLSKLSSPARSRHTSPSTGNMSHSKKKMIQRAVVVIRKAVTKRGLKDDVVKFLRNKGMGDDDIALAYQQAEHESKKPEEKIVHLKGLLTFKTIELDSHTKQCNEMNKRIRGKKSEVEKLRAACMRAFEGLHVTQGEEGLERKGEEGHTLVLKEIRSKVKKLEKNNQAMTGKQGGVFDTELKRLQQMEACLLSGQSFCCYLLFLSLESSIQKGLRRTRFYLSEWELLK